MKFRSKKGAVLLYVIMIFCLLTILGGGLIALTNHNTRMTQTEIRSEQAYQSALSGLEYTLESFIQDPTTGQSIAQDIRGGAKPTTKLELGNVGTVKIELSCAEGSPCKKIAINSSATVKGLTKSVVGYLNIIEGGFGKPVNVPRKDSYVFNGVSDAEYCLFPEPNGDEGKCFKKNGILNQFDIIDPLKFNLAKYTLYLNTAVTAIEKTYCPTSGVISKSCTIQPIKDEASIKNEKIEIDNSKGNIFINLGKGLTNLEKVQLSITNPESENIVVIFVNEMQFSDVEIGNSIADSDNILILGKLNTQTGQRPGSIKHVAHSWDSNIYGWIVLGVRGYYETSGKDKKLATIHGGLYVSTSVAQHDSAYIKGIQASAGMLGILAEAGIEPNGGGGAMTFAKTYDK